MQQFHLFECQEYRAIIRYFIELNKDSRGYQSRLAKAAGCQRSVISQVLGEKLHLTLEQAQNLVDFWRLSESEADFFIYLVLLERAATKNLKAMWTEKIQSLKSKQQDLAHQFQVGTIQHGEMPSYYRSYLFALTHVALSIPTYQAPEALAERFHLPKSVVSMLLTQLQQLGLATKLKGKWQLTAEQIHLPKQSSMTAMNHMNWKNLAIQDIQKMNSNSLHYDGAITLSNDDFMRLKSVLIEAIHKQRKIVEETTPEDVFCIGISLFKP